MRKMKSRILGFVTIVCWMAFATSGQLLAQEVIIFATGAPSSTAGMSIAHTFVVADDFEVPSASVLQAVRFWAWQPGPNWDGTGRWFIFLDESGLPASVAIASGDAFEIAQTADLGDGLFEYELSLDVPFALEPDVRYWLGLHLGGFFLSWVQTGETGEERFGHQPIQNHPTNDGLNTGEFSWGPNTSPFDRAFVLFGESDGGGAIQVTMDVKPGSEGNPVHPGKPGVIPVAILTTGEFDATTVDPLSVAFGPNAAPEADGIRHLEDVDGDGNLDLVLHFRTDDSGIACGDETVSLTGQTSDGDPIEGSDSIQTVGCK